MKKFMALFLVFSLLVLSGNLIAQRRNIEVGLGAVGLAYEEDFWIIPMPAISLGFHTTKGIGIELGGIIGSGGAIMSGNVVLSPFNIQRFIPYATGGLVTSTSGGLLWNIGGGLKIKLNEKLAIRAEYRWLFSIEGEFGVNIIPFGISLFF